MMMLLLLACVPDPSEALGGCTVTAVRMDAEDVMQEEVTSVYDGEGRIVSQRTLVGENGYYPSGTVMFSTFVHEDGCQVLLTGRLEVADEVVYEGETRTVCDEHGHVEREGSESWRKFMGEVVESAWSVEKENQHDKRGRLTSEATRYNGEAEPETRTEYGWAPPCDGPAEVNQTSGEFHSRETQVCRPDGQGLEGDLELLDQHGERLAFYRWQRQYDILGRLVEEVHDEGFATEIFQRITYAYAANTPGPIEELTEFYGELGRVVHYTYECKG